MTQAEDTILPKAKGSHSAVAAWKPSIVEFEKKPAKWSLHQDVLSKQPLLVDMAHTKHKEARLRAHLPHPRAPRSQATRTAALRHGERG